MNIIIPTIGSRGDIQPFIALAQGLTHAGHKVTLASHPVMRALVEAHGVGFAPIGPDIDLSQRVAAIRKKARNPVIGLIQGMRFGFEMLERSHDDLMVLCRGGDLVVVPSAVAAGKNEAELLNIPYLSVTLLPWAIPWDDPHRPLIKRMAYRFIDGLVSVITTLPLNRIRQRQGLPPVGREGFTSPRLNIIPVSPAVFPPIPQWESRHRLVGYWLVEAPGEWRPPTDLIAFLKNGAAPLLVSLGAMSLGGSDTLEVARLFVGAIEQAGVRAVVQGWNAGMQQLALPPSVYPAGDLPHTWLLLRCAGVIHHGGFGTTAAGLWAGVPALVIPHIADQFYWGQRLQQLGVGLPAMPRRKLSCQALAAGLHELAHNEDLHNAASSLGEQIRLEKGVENAVTLIGETYG